MKRLLILFVLLFIVFFSKNVVAQQMVSLKGKLNFSFPEKIHKLVLDPLPAGTYSVGTGGYFPTIDSAFNKLSIDGIAGEVILELIDNLYTAPTDSFGFLLNGPIPGAGPNSRVTIKPAANKNVIIESNGGSAFTFLNTNFVTADGIGLTGSTTLTFHTFQNTQFLWNDGIDFLFNSDHNVIQNIIFIDEDYNRGGGGIGFWNTLGSQFACDSNLIQNNFIKASGIAIYVSAFNNSSVKAKDNIIRGNTIGSETDSLLGYGIQVELCQNTLIENNIVQNVRYYNRPNVNTVRGINSYYGNGDVIRNNIVHNINTIGDMGSTGILLSGDNGATGINNQVYNNMVYDIRSSSIWSSSRVAGIQIWNQNNPKIYYNSVYLYGTGANVRGSAALFIWGSSTNVDARNNILVNTRDESQFCASAIYDYSASNFITSDYNDLYYEPNQYNCLVRIGSTNYLTLADWQAMGKDLHSLNESVNFISPTDLHINNNYYTLLDEHATPITGIDNDFDGDVRHATTPDIGADEFELSSSASNWQMQNSNFPVDVFVINFSAVNSQVCWAVGQKYPANSTPYAGYIRTTDGGTNWTINTIPGISNGYLDEIFAIDADTAYITCYKLVGTTGTIGIYKTTDGGVTWNRQDAYNSSQTGPAYIYFFDSQNGVVIGGYLEAYTTTNGGLNWNPVTMPTPLTDEWTWLGESRFTVSGNSIWFCTNKGRVFKSTDKGYTWAVILSESQYYDWRPSIAFQNEQVGIYTLNIGGNETDHIVRKTTDGGANWTTLSNPVIDNLAPSSMQHIPGSISTYIVVGGRTSTMRGTAVTYDAGESWNLIDTLGCFLINFASDAKGWGSQWGTNIVYNYVGPRIISSVEKEIIDIVPTGYTLSQNYPNPFNPGTTFRYSIPTQSKVVIKVYDILGNEITTLMDEEKSVGTYEITWNAASLPSGVYFYQLKAGSFVSTKKMILIR